MAKEKLVNDITKGIMSTLESPGGIRSLSEDDPNAENKKGELEAKIRDEVKEKVEGYEHIAGIYWIAMITLCLLVLAVAFAGMRVLFTDPQGTAIKIPESLVTIGSTALGAIVGIFAKSKSE